VPKSHLSRFVDVITNNDGAVFAEPSADRRHQLVEYDGRRFDPPVILDFTESEFDAALEAIGRSSQSLWPGAPPMEVGLRLALVHLLESMDPQTPQPRRMYINSSGLMVE
jgi:hypothetical protein